MATPEMRIDCEINSSGNSRNVLRCYCALVGETHFSVQIGDNNPWPVGVMGVDGKRNIGIKQRNVVYSEFSPHQLCFIDVHREAFQRGDHILTGWVGIDANVLCDKPFGGRVVKFVKISNDASVFQLLSNAIPPFAIESSLIEIINKTYGSSQRDPEHHQNG